MAIHETITVRTARISGFLGLQRSTVGLLTMVVLVGMGERMAEFVLLAEISRFEYFEKWSKTIRYHKN